LDPIAGLAKGLVIANNNMQSAGSPRRMSIL
jgi:hypothetical protein